MSKPAISKLTPFDDLEIITKGEATLYGSTFKATPLGDELVMIVEYIDGKPQPSSKAVVPEDVKKDAHEYGMKHAEKDKEIKFRLSEYLFEQFRAACEAEGVNPSEQVRTLMAEWLENRNYNQKA